MFDKIRVCQGWGYSEYRVTGYDGLTDEELIDKCDYCNFGGRVSRYGDYAIVKVYTD